MSKIKIYKSIELITLFFLIPLLFYYKIVVIFVLIPLWALFALALFLLFMDSSFDRKILFDFRVDKQALKTIFKRYLFFLPLMLVAVLLFIPDKLFAFPLNKPYIWVLVVLLYPILSAYQQEVIYRTFFIHRYGELFSSKQSLIFFNALAFGFMHIVFGNLISPALSFIGGLIFMSTYLRTKSLFMTSIEHTLYGLSIFTVGLGVFFFNPL